MKKELFLDEKGYVVKDGRLVGYYGDPFREKILVLPDSAPIISFEAVEYASVLAEKVVIPEGVRVIEFKAFKDFYSMKEITLPSTLERIGENAFSNSSLKHLDLPDSLTEIGDCFISHTPIANLVIPPKVRLLPSFLLDKSNIQELSITKDQFDQVLLILFAHSPGAGKYVPFGNSYIKTLNIDGEAYDGKKLYNYVENEYEFPEDIADDPEKMTRELRLHPVYIEMLFSNSPFFD